MTNTLKIHTAYGGESDCRYILEPYNHRLLSMQDYVMSGAELQNDATPHSPKLCANI